MFTSLVLLFLLLTAPVWAVILLFVLLMLCVALIFSLAYLLVGITWVWAVLAQLCRKLFRGRR